MKDIELKPIKELPFEYEAIEKKIVELFRREIYAPLVKTLKAPDAILKNSTWGLIDALGAGRVSFYRGKFTGSFNAQVSKELKNLGAKWSRADSAFVIRKDDLPLDVRNAIVVSDANFQKTRERIADQIGSLNPAEIADRLNVEKLFDATLWKLNTDFLDSIKGISVAPDLTKADAARIASEYTNNMKLDIKGWVSEEIKGLREKMMRSEFAGFRYEGMVKMIERSYGVSQAKAKFLAKQETSLLMAKFRQTRYESAGSRKYKWSCVAGSPSHPVRPMHKALDGKIFSWDNPPVVNGKGERKNPGEDFGCRCFARAIVSFAQ